MLNITLGTDPELFLKDQSGKFVSAHDLIPGSKKQPHAVPYGAIQPDGVAAEFNTAPAQTADQFIHNIDEVISAMTKQFQSLRPDLTVAITPTATFDREYFDTLPIEATMLGCTPDFNAYTGEENEPPSTDEPFRTGAGHMHVGWGRGFRVTTEGHFEPCRNLVKQLDTVLYFSSLLWDSDDKRRSLYGKIGAFRPKSYGVEYRPMSNAYLQTKEIQRSVFDITMYCSDLLLNQDIKLYEDGYAQEMVTAVHEGVVLSSAMIKDYLQYMNEKYGTPVVSV